MTEIAASESAKHGLTNEKADEEIYSPSGLQPSQSIVCLISRFNIQIGQDCLE